MLIKQKGFFTKYINLTIKLFASEMLLQLSKESPATTQQSWLTPNKHKNPSSIQTNPSSTINNNNILSYPSNQYSTIELSESIGASPSFLSPSKEIGSFLMTPYAHSKRQFSHLSSGMELVSEFRLKTESIMSGEERETSKFYDVVMNGQKQREIIKPSRSQQQISPSEIGDLMKLINEVRTAKKTKEFYSAKIIQQQSIQSFLLNQISDKEESIFLHKEEVEHKIKKKNRLKEKLRVKKEKLKLKAKHQAQNLAAKIEKLNQEYRLTQSLIFLEQMKVQRMGQQFWAVQEELKHVHKHQYQALSHGHPSAHPIYGHTHLYHSHPHEQEFIDSKTKHVNLKNVPGFDSNSSNPNSSRGPQSKRSQKSKPSNPQGSSSSVMDTLQNHISNIMMKVSSPQNSGNFIDDKHRRFSFGENPSFNMLANNYSNQSKQPIPIKPVTQNGLNLGNIVDNLMQKVVNHQQVTELSPTRRLNVNNQNPESISPQKQQNQPPFISEGFKDISPIASIKKVKFDDQIKKSLEKIQSIQNHNYPTDKKQLQEMIQELQAEEEKSEFELLNYNESQIRINADGLSESPLKRSPRQPIMKKSSKSPVTHQRSPSNQTGGRKSLRLPISIEQSIVNIACESSECSDNLQRRHDFSPRKEEQVIKRIRSPTHQVTPAIHEEMFDLRNTQNKVMASNNGIRDSSKHSGADTPIFRSQNSQEDGHIGFSRPFLGGSLKESQCLEDSHQREQDLMHKNQKRLNKYNESQGSDKKGQKMYLTEIVHSNNQQIRPHNQPYSIFQTQTLNTIQTEQNHPIEQMDESDDDFYSCTLNTESKVHIDISSKSPGENTPRAHEQDSNKNQQKEIKSSRTPDQQQRERNHKDGNLVLENAKNGHHYDLGLNLSRIGDKKYQNQNKRHSLELAKTKLESFKVGRDSFMKDKNESEKNYRSQQNDIVTIDDHLLTI